MVPLSCVFLAVIGVILLGHFPVNLSVSLQVLQHTPAVLLHASENGLVM